MSENTNPTAEQLVRNVTFSLQRSTVIPMPIDPTLSNEGEAADAKATGDAIAAIVAVKKVLGQSPDSTGDVTSLNATMIPMTSEEGAQTISEAILGVQAQTADTILYVAGNADTVKDVVDGIISDCTNGCTDDEIDAIFDDWGDDE